MFLSSLAAFALTLWLIPGISVRAWPSAIVAAVALALVSTVSRPVLIAMLAGISVALVGVATLLLQALALLAIAGVSNGLAVDGPRSAVIASVVYAVTHTLLSAALAISNDESFFGTLVRQLAAHREHGRERDAGVIFIQIDGLSLPLLQRAIASGLVPTLARWSSTGHVLDAWQPLLPTQTSASQAGILHGSNDGIPGFRWFEKDSGRLFVSNHPSDAHDIELRVSDGRGLLVDGASIGNLLSGDAPRSYLTAATVETARGELRRSHVLDWFFVSPYAYVRWLVLSVGEIVKEVVQARRERRVAPRGARAFPYPFARAATNVVLRHLVTSLVIEEMYEGTRVIYADLVDYDEIAHHAGVDRIEARQALRGIDNILAIIERAELDASRPYRFVILSDHGQTPGPFFRERFGTSLEDIAGRLMGADVATSAAPAPEHAGRIATLNLQALSSLGGILRPARPATRARDRGAPPELVVAASGNMAHLYLTRLRGRLTREEIEARYPELIPGLVRHPGIGFVMVRSADGVIALGRGASRELRAERADGEDPLAPYGPTAVSGLLRVDAMPNCGDLVVLSAFDPTSGEGIAFEDQVGSHGGLGGSQSDAFVLHPREWPLEGPIVGATELHRVFRSWSSAGHGKAD
ncbi:MAG: hypothetical protein AUH85_18285 [Chloroflexi bacterium 13_1_40CM_4_68_4]|nr:MAG: hypothetical protein AUH85_18285 [Chloroflexi bacterium 13_1_40CM_4_68_4]